MSLPFRDAATHSTPRPWEHSSLSIGLTGDRGKKEEEEEKPRPPRRFWFLG
jgi:hypothetical protein